MIQLNSDHFFVKWFYMTERLKQRFYPHLQEKYVTFNPETPYTNFCYMVRSMTVQLPFMLLAQLAMYILPVMAAVVMPVYWYGNPFTVYLTLAKIFGCLAILIGFIAGCVILIESINKKRTARRAKEYEDWRNGVITPDPPPGAWQLFKQYLAAKKEGICPSIAITKKDDNTNAL